VEQQVTFIRPASPTEFGIESIAFDMTNLAYRWADPSDRLACINAMLDVLGGLLYEAEQEQDLHAAIDQLPIYPGDVA
jgi:hypothetical protein